MTSPLAEAVMVAYCGWDPNDSVVNAVAVLDGNGTTSLVLPSLHVTAVSSVVVTLADSSTYTATIGAAGDVGWSANGVLEWHPWVGSQLFCWPEGSRNVAVTYSGGYSSPPADLIAALDSLDGRLPTMQSGVSRAKVGTADLTYAPSLAAGGLLMVEQMVFDKYRIVRVA